MRTQQVVPNDKRRSPSFLIPPRGQGGRIRPCQLKVDADESRVKVTIHTKYNGMDDQVRFELNHTDVLRLIGNLADALLQE